MTAYNYTQPVDSTSEQLDWRSPQPKWDVFPNFNGQVSIPYRGNFAVTGSEDLPHGLLWTAHYAISGPNTITIQFSSPLQQVSTTTSDYTLSGPSAPSISSVTWVSGSRSILLSLSAPLVTTNTYTLSIGPRKVISGSQIGYVTPKAGTYNWPNLVVDVIQPTSIAVVGVGIEQLVETGTPSCVNDGSLVGVGIEQSADVGTPSSSLILAATGIGVEQPVDVGSNPAAGLFATCTGVGVSQPISVGVGSVFQQQQPIGVGISQPIGIGVPTADITPITTTGVGISQSVYSGTPQIIGGVLNTIAIGIAQGTSVGTPVAAKLNTQDVAGVGIEQLIAAGVPIGGIGLTPTQIGLEQPIAVGVPLASPFSQQAAIGVGIEQLADIGTPTSAPTVMLVIVGIEQPAAPGVAAIDSSAALIGSGISQPINIGLSRSNFLTSYTGVGIGQPVDAGAPAADFLNRALNVGINQLVNIGLPTVGSMADVTSVGIPQGTQVGMSVSLISLTVSVRQGATFLDLDTALQKAFAHGVDGSTPDLMLAIQDYLSQFTGLQQSQTKNPFENLACATLVALNIPGALPNTNASDTATVANNIPLVFTDGILTYSYVLPIELSQPVDVGIPAVIMT